MILKQSVSKEEKIKFCIGIIGINVPVLLLSFFIRPEELKAFALFLALFWLPYFVLFLLIGLCYLEWYCIYDDHIDVRTIYGIKNSVFYNNVCFVEKVEINLTSRGTKRTFFVFNDGRKNNNNLFNVNSCYNNKKYNLRIYKTPEIENFLTNYLSLKINNA